MKAPKFLLFLVFCISVAFPSFVSKAQETEVINLLPRTHSQPSIVTKVEVAAGYSIALRPIPPQLLSRLRWATPGPLDATCRQVRATANERLREANSEAGTAHQLFSNLIQMAENQILELQLDSAQESIHSAKRLVPCLENVLSTDEIRSLFLNEAVALLYSNDVKYRQVFQDLIAADPRLDLDPQYPPAVHEALLDAAKQLVNRSVILISLDEAYGKAMIDGKSLPSLETPNDSTKAPSDYRIRSGQHVIQIIGPIGELRSVMLQIAAEDQGDEVALENLAELGLAPARSLEERLRREVTENAIGASTAHGLQTFLDEIGADHLYFAVITPMELQMELRVYRPGKGLVTASQTEFMASKITDVAVASSDLPTVSPISPNLHLDVSLLTHHIIKTQYEYVMSPTRLGYAIGAGMTRSQLTFQLLFGIFPHTLFTKESNDCGDYNGDSAPTETQIESAASCMKVGISGQASGYIGLQLSYDHWEFVPKIGINLMRVPSVFLLHDTGSQSGVRTYETYAGGPSLRFQATHGFGKPSLKSRISLEVGSSTLVASTGASRIILVPIEFGLGVSLGR